MQLEVDIETSYEFIKEIYTNIQPEYLQGLSKLMEEKAELFSRFLDLNMLESSSQDDLLSIYKKIFSLKKFTKKWTSDQFEQMKDYIFNLLYGKDSFVDRFNIFCARLKTNLNISRPYEVASEILAFTSPLEYCLWSNWIYNPDSEHGSLLLVFRDTLKLQAKTHAELYLQIIETQNKLKEIAVDIGISPSPEHNSVFDVPVFLCAVYAIYTFTVTKLRMTNEFNTILPNLDELLARLLGVYVTETKVSALT